MLTKMRKRQNNTGDKRKPIERQVAFIEFKGQEVGQQHEEKIKECRANIRTQRSELRDKTNSCNQVKSQIDRVKSQLDAKMEMKQRDLINQGKTPGFSSHTAGFDEDGPMGDQQEIIDEEELALIKDLKDLKRQYRTTFQDLRDVKQEIQFTQQSID